MSIDNFTELKDRIKLILELADMDQSKFAEETGISQGWVSQIMKGTDDYLDRGLIVGRVKWLFQEVNE